MKKSFDISKESDIPEVVKEIMPLLEHKIILLKGDLGAGKTTFTKCLLKAFDSHDLVNSPTYSIVNEYNSEMGRIYHFDLYRLNQVSEVYDIGIQDYIDSGDYCIIEWPEIFQKEIEDDFHEISIFMEDNRRILNFNL